MPKNNSSQQEQRQQSESQFLKGVSELRNVHEDQYKLGALHTLECIVGIRPDTNTATCFINEQRLPKKVEILKKDGKKIQDYIKEPLPVTDVLAVQVGDEKYALKRDAWGNPRAALITEHSNPEQESRYKAALEKSISLWEAAISGEEELLSQIEEMLGAEVQEIVVNLVAQVEKYPEMQKYSIFASRVDMWDFSSSGSVLAAAEKNLEAFLNITKKDKLLAEKCREVKRKIRNHQPLSDDDRYFIDALKVSQFVTRKSIRNYDTYSINNFTRKYALANLIENRLCADLVGENVYSLHQADFAQFRDVLEKSGFSLPDWFQPYLGNEFVWGFIVDAVRATSGGQFFLDSLDDENKIRSTLTHERVHVIADIAERLGDEKNKVQPENELSQENEKYEEVYTETLALLIKHQGNVSAAIEENQDSTVAYCTGVDRLLGILQEIDQDAGNDLLATQLMIQGLIEMSEGKTKSQTEVIKNYFDQNIKGDKSFDELMSSFTNEKIYFDKWGYRKICVGF